MATFIITRLIIDWAPDCVYRHENENPRGSTLLLCLISIDRLLVLGAFLWDDPDEDQ